MSRTTDIADRTLAVIRSKNTRNVLFLVISVFCVLMINSLLPIIEGSAHYTEAPEEMTYKEYLELSDPNYNLTWGSQKDIQNYIDEYCKENPEITIDERVNIVLPDTFKVTVYTKFFFSYLYWWVSTLTHIVSTLLIYYSVFNYILSKRKQKYQRYIDLTDEINKAVNEQLDPSTFEPWMSNTFNKLRKRKQHMANIKYEIDMLERKTPYEVRHDEKHRLHNKYAIKKASLEEQLTEEYLDNYVPNKKVKGFRYIHPTFVTSGYNVLGTSVDNYSLIKSDGKKISSDGTRKILSSILLTTMFAVLLTFTVGTSIDKPWYWVIINIIVKMAPMLLQIPLAYDYCDQFMEDQLITNLISRRNIALLYLADMKNREVVEQHGS